MQIALLGRSARVFAPRGAWDIAAARREAGKDRVETLYDFRFPSDHHAIAALQPPNAAAGADIDVVDALGRQFLGSADVIDVIGVAAIDQDIVAFEMGQQIGDGLVDHAGRDHQPDGAGPRQHLRELGRRGGADGSLSYQVSHGLRRHVEDRTTVAALQ